MGQDDGVSLDEIQQTVADAFVYAYPMVFNYKTLFNQVVNTQFPGYVGGFGKFRNYDRVYTPADTDIVTASNDTPYSWAWLDLRSEPWVLTVPPVPGDRYVTFQWFDLFTYNFAYVGVLSTGRQGGSYLFTGPDFDGDIPAGINKVFSSETQVIGRLPAGGLPPVQLFWSITLYDLPNRLLVANPIDRYSIGDRTKGLIYGDDGSLTLAFQHDEPADPAARANWLPTPADGWTAIFRLYGPEPPVIDGTWTEPPMIKTT